MRKTLALLGLGIAVLFALTGCSGNRQTAVNPLIKGEPGENEYQVYYTNGEETLLLSQTYTAESVGTAELLEELTRAMNQVPENGGYKKVRPENMNTFYDYSLNDSGQLTLYYDSTYSVLSGTSEVLYRAAVVKTMTQIPEVDYIEFYVNDMPLVDYSQNKVGFMSADNFIDNASGEINYYQNTTMVLYFASPSGTKLVETNINVVYDGTIPMEKLVVEQLMKGPDVIEGLEEGTALATVPSSAVLQKITVSEGICYVDFSEEFLTKIPNITDRVAIYSVVNSLTELDNVNKVQFLINGETKAIYQSSKGFDQFFERNLDMVEGE